VGLCPLRNLVFMMTDKWPPELPAIQVRIARPTDRLSEVLRFYSEGLGLKEIGSFRDHDGYTGFMLGLPGQHYHLEFTTHENGSPCPGPTKDNLLVFYIPDPQAVGRLIERLNSLGYFAVAPENPYWGRGGVTFEDPDGWRVVLMQSGGI
jgi:catechol 2,3-dioxygenase-like lactoylglutathione lyase family enzyme